MSVPPVPTGLAESLRRLGAARDPAAWEHVLVCVGPVIDGLAKRLTGDAELARDAVQETLLMVRDDAASFHPPTDGADQAAQRWITRICANAAMQLLRRRSRRRRFEQAAAIQGRSESPDPSGSLMQNETVDIVRGALSELREPVRVAIILRHVAGLGFTEIAATLGVPVGTAKIRVHRGLEQLRRRLQPMIPALSLTVLVSLVDRLSAAEHVLAVAPALAPEAAKALLLAPQTTTISGIGSGVTGSTLAVGTVGLAMLALVTTLLLRAPAPPSAPAPVIAGPQQDAPLQRHEPTPVNLVPPTPNLAGDYFTTTGGQERSPTPAPDYTFIERNLIGDAHHPGWINAYPLIRGDLYLVLDEGWSQEDSADGFKPHERRLPSFAGPGGLAKLVRVAKDHGWGGLGLRIAAANAAPSDPAIERRDLTTILKRSAAAGIGYWKLSNSAPPWRTILGTLQPALDSQLLIETPASDGRPGHRIIRLGDFDRITGVPDAIAAGASCLKEHGSDWAGAVLVLSDEPYVAAGLGGFVGIERLPSDRPIPQDGRDESFRRTEAVRAVRWHRLAPPVPIIAGTQVDGQRLESDWDYQPGDSWEKRAPGAQQLRVVAPARLSRGMPLPEVVADDPASRPYVLTSRSANGAVAIVAIGRTHGRRYVTPAARVQVAIGSGAGPVGIFGSFAALTLSWDQDIGSRHLWAQDLASDHAEDITSAVIVRGASVLIPGSVIARVGTTAATAGDQSEPGLVLLLLPPF